VVLPQHRFYFRNVLLAAHADEEHVHQHHQRDRNQAQCFDNQEAS